MDDTWVKTQLEQMSNVAARLRADVEKFEAELVYIRQRMGVHDSRPADTLKRFERSYGAAVAKNLAKDIEAAIMHPGESWQQEEE